MACLLTPLVAACRPPSGTSSTAPVADAGTRAAIQQEQSLDQTERNSLGIPPFRWNGQDPRLTALGFAIADLLVTDLSQSAQLQLVERARLGEVLNEIDLAGAGRVDSASAPRVGRLLGAQRLLLGSVDTLPNGEFRLGVRLADVVTGALTQALDARASSTNLLDAEKVIVFRLFDALGITLTPAERAAIDSDRPVLSLDALTAYGEGVQAELAGDRRQAYARFSQASTLAADFQAARQRATAVRETATGESAAALRPGVRSIGAAVSGTVDRLNRPLDLITSFARPSSGASDPAFPSTIVTVVVQVRRP